ncbi:MAG: 3-phosphoglycerate dehydrogenase [Acutalibacteraceae bacterium]|nr:3-phosphoglycerate dehydrogenase [Oscillospiraceae bacterium]
MYKILTLNKIAKVGLDVFGENYVCGECEAPDAIMVRSASMHETEFADNTLAVARAGAGVNNIPLDRCSEKGIVVFNTPGANANAVKELVIASLFLSSRKIAAGYEWCKTLKGECENVGKLVEKGKSQFAGPEIFGKTLGVIGLGAIGMKVAESAAALGMKVVAYDIRKPDKMPDGTIFTDSLDGVYTSADYITLHLPLLESTAKMINSQSISKMKDSVRILNFARGGLVDDADLIAALESGKIASYVTDFPSDAVIGVPGVTAIPHLGASTPESEDNCAVMAAEQIKLYIETGSIKNSVNMPNIILGDKTEKFRHCIIHRNCCEIAGNIKELTGKECQTVTRGDYSYTVFDCDADFSQQVKDFGCVIRVRVI